MDLVGIAGAESFDGYRWQDSVMRDPHLTLPEAKAIVIVGVHEKGLSAADAPANKLGRIARSYASGHEYNLTNELEPIRNIIVEQGYQAVISPGGIADSTVPLKLTAVRAGLGWQGKHSVIITGDYGSYVSWGGLITDAPLIPDKPSSKGGCGKCRLCMDACPTGAIESPYIVNMSKCLDEILNEGGILTPELMERIGHRVLSCDACLDACPFSKKVLKRRADQDDPNRWIDLGEALSMDAAGFRKRFSSFGWSLDLLTFQRNCLIALGNTGDISDIPKVKLFLESNNKMLKQTAQWAIERIKTDRE